MPWMGRNGGEAGASRRRRVRSLLLAVVLATATAFLAAGSASADWWPHVSTDSVASSSGSGGAQHR